MKLTPQTSHGPCSLAISFFFIIVSLIGVLGRDQRQDPLVASNSSAEACGTISDIANKVEVCAKPLVDILRGSVEKWPRTERDAGDLCDSFSVAERCIREVGRRCTKGLQRTIISTLASSIQRARKRECQKPKLPGVLRTTLCVEKYQIDIRSLVANVTARLDVIENRMRDADVKTNAVCCMVHSIESEIKQLLNPKCPAETKIVINLYRGVLEDVIELICRSPKCNDLFKGYRIGKAIVDPDNPSKVIASLLRIVFSLG